MQAIEQHIASGYKAVNYLYIGERSLFKREGGGGAWLRREMFILLKILLVQPNVKNILPNLK
jgi:hypothetical protein